MQEHSAKGAHNKVNMWHVLWVSKRTRKQISSAQHRMIRRR